MYDSSIKYKWDNKDVLDYAVNEGREKVIQEGMMQGVMQGIEQSEIKGQLKTNNRIALELKSQGFAVYFIKKLTHLTTAQIEEL